MRSCDGEAEPRLIFRRSCHVGRACLSCFSSVSTSRAQSSSLLHLLLFWFCFTSFSISKTTLATHHALLLSSAPPPHLASSADLRQAVAHSRGICAMHADLEDRWRCCLPCKVSVGKASEVSRTESSGEYVTVVIVDAVSRVKTKIVTKVN
ncbi:hypothetical protein Micbo1qcDRAFT_23908 [Microdochium bolleyi]|uniref:Uncharacterized protein n=1 Tax=Microdochium bolleyi TaxID=196109 RepID=A0A136JD16_9PEZI|nr:hypothetical protein Micbo1qcDRAFT_23908 [Microdochium bolleyi]